MASMDRAFYPLSRARPRHGSRYARRMSQPRDPVERSRMTRQVMELRLAHRDLDAAIERLQADLQADELMLKRLKKRKLQLKDQIAWIENALIPDEPA